MATVDLNSDLGEGAGTEQSIMPFITSANIACGAHAGDERSMRETIRLATANGVAPGAHPGYRDPANFGRKALDIPADVLTAAPAPPIRPPPRVPPPQGTDLTPL